jgi:hypothetical protein
MIEAAAAEDEPIALLLPKREAAIRGEEMTTGLFAAVEEIVELPDGYRYRFAGEYHQLAAPLSS